MLPVKIEGTEHNQIGGSALRSCGGFNLGALRDILFYPVPASSFLLCSLCSEAVAM